MHKRLKKLEKPSHTLNHPRIIFTTIVAATEDGPENLGIATANIIKGKRLNRSDYPNNGDFKVAVSENYTSVYGEPLSWDDDEVFYECIVNEAGEDNYE